MKRSIVRTTIGVLGLAMVAGIGTGAHRRPRSRLTCWRASKRRPQGRAAANKAAASAQSAADAAARAEAAVAKIEGGWRQEYNK